jgi:type I restriction enzyme, S subunit
MKTMLPTGWTTSRMRDLGEFFGGSTPSTHDSTLWGGSIRWLVPNEISSLQESTILICETKTRLSEKGYRTCSTHLLPRGSIAVSSRATVGDCIILAREMCTNQGFVNIVCSDHVDSLFLLYWLRHNKPLLLRHAAGTTFDEIGRRTFKNLRISYPLNVREQRRIGRAILVTDVAISAARASIAKTEHLQKGLMQQLLTGRLKPDGTPRKKAEFWQHPKVGFVPVGWGVSPLKGLAEIQRGRFSHRPRNEPRFFDGPYPFIQTADIVASRGYICKHSQTLNEEGRRISRSFPKGTIMITIAANIGDTGIAAYDVYATDSVIGITPTGSTDSEFLEFCLRMRKAYLRRMATESAQANINYGNLRPLLIMHPPTPEEQRDVAEPIANCERLILAKEHKIATLQQLKKCLMQNLLTGRIRLSMPG